MKMPLKRLSAAVWCRGEEGGALIEMAVALPVLFTLIFCFIEMCLALYAKNMISESAREGTRYAIYRGSTCKTTNSVSCQVTANQVNTYVMGLGWPNLAGGTMAVNTTFPPKGTQDPGTNVMVVVSYTLPIQVPYTPTNTLSFSSTSQMRILQ